MHLRPIAFLALSLLLVESNAVGGGILINLSKKEEIPPYRRDYPWGDVVYDILAGRTDGFNVNIEVKKTPLLETWMETSSTVLVRPRNVDRLFATYNVQVAREGRKLKLFSSYLRQAPRAFRWGKREPRERIPTSVAGFLAAYVHEIKTVPKNTLSRPAHLSLDVQNPEVFDHLNRAILDREESMELALRRNPAVATAMKFAWAIGTNPVLLRASGTAVTRLLESRPVCPELHSLDFFIDLKDSSRISSLEVYLSRLGGRPSR